MLQKDDQQVERVQFKAQEREEVNQQRNTSYTCKDNSIIYLIDIATIITLVSYFFCLVGIATLFTLVILLFSPLLLKRTLILQLLLLLQILLLLLLLRVLFLLRQSISIWNIRVVGSISGISSPREFCLDNKTYNILSEIGDRIDI